MSKRDWPCMLVKLEDVILSLNTGLNPRMFFKLNTEDATNYYVTIREIRGGKLIFTERTDRINDEALKLCNNRSNLEVGDVLFSGTGTIGETLVVEDEPKNWNIKEGVYTIKPNPSKLNPYYLKHFGERNLGSYTPNVIKKGSGWALNIHSPSSPCVPHPAGTATEGQSRLLSGEGQGYP